MIVLHERNEGDVRRFDDAIHRAKSGLMEACEIWNSMKEDFSQIGGYSERYSERGWDYPTHRMSERDWNELQERRRRDGMGRY